VFEARHMQRLQGNMGIGHVRYPTAGSSSASEAQPFYVNSPYGITLAHNGNLTNAHELRQKLFEEKRRHINTTSDSEILLNVFASELDNFRHYPLEADNIFAAVAATNRLIRGAYACVAMIIGHGMVAFRDPNGIRPLVLGKRDLGDGRTEYMVASESVALDTLGFEFLRDVAPGEAVYITEKGQLFTRDGRRLLRRGARRPAVCDCAGQPCDAVWRQYRRPETSRFYSRSNYSNPQRVQNYVP
jgi:amidophosphoribosyltransferase